MNIQGANPNIKAFLFFILVLASGLFSMILALYFDKIFPKVLQEKEIPANYYPSEAMKASLAPDFNSFDQVQSSNTSEMSSIYGSLTPAVEAFISVKSVDNGKAFHFVVNNSGDFTLRNIAAGPY